MARTTRKLTIKMVASSGTINRFFAFLNGERVISAEGNTTPTYSTEVSMSPVNLKVRVWGIEAASYVLSIDLPETADDQTLNLKLSQGYHELEITI
jgi:hypothetical protein